MKKWKLDEELKKGEKKGKKGENSVVEPELLLFVGVQLHILSKI